MCVCIFMSPCQYLVCLWTSTLPDNGVKGGQRARGRDQHDQRGPGARRLLYCKDYGNEAGGGRNSVEDKNGNDGRLQATASACCPMHLELSTSSSGFG